MFTTFGSKFKVIFISIIIGSDRQSECKLGKIDSVRLGMVWYSRV